MNLRTLRTFFGVLELLLAAGVRTVAEAAYQDRWWRPGLETPRDRAEIRIAHCSVDAPWIEVDTTDGRVPGLEEIVAFVTGGGGS